MKKFIIAIVAVAFLATGVVYAADLYHNANAVLGIASVNAGTGDTPIVGTVVDGLGYGSITYIINIGDLDDVDATFTVLLEDCEEVACDTTNANVADADLYGTEALASFTIADNNSVKMLGYSGRKRFTRMTITPANNTGSDVNVGVVAVRGHPQYTPVSH